MGRRLTVVGIVPDRDPEIQHGLSIISEVDVITGRGIRLGSASPVDLAPVADSEH